MMLKPPDDLPSSLHPKLKPNPPVFQVFPWESQIQIAILASRQEIIYGCLIYIVVFIIMKMIRYLQSTFKNL